MESKPLSIAAHLSFRTSKSAAIYPEIFNLRNQEGWEADNLILEARNDGPSLLEDDNNPQRLLTHRALTLEIACNRIDRDMILYPRMRRVNEAILGDALNIAEPTNRESTFELIKKFMLSTYTGGAAIADQLDTATIGQLSNEELYAAINTDGIQGLAFDFCRALLVFRSRKELRFYLKNVLETENPEAQGSPSQFIETQLFGPKSAKEAFVRLTGNTILSAQNIF